MSLTIRYVSSSGSGTYAGSTSLAAPMSWATMLTSAAAGDDIRVLPGTYSRGATSDTATGAGTATSPIILRGCDALGALLTPSRTNGNGPLITTAYPLITYAAGRLSTGNFWIFEALSFSAANNSGALVTGTSSAVKSVKSTNSNTGSGAAAVTINNYGIIYDCDLSLTGASGGGAAVLLLSGANSVRIVASRITGGTAAGISCTASTAAFIAKNVFVPPHLNCILASSSAIVTCLDNTIQGASGDGVTFSAAPSALQLFAGNMITDNGGYAVNMFGAAAAPFIAHNRTRDNASGAINLGTDWAAATTYSAVTTDTGGAATDYTDTTTGDLSLIAASPAVAVNTFYPSSIGALQSAGSGGGIRLNNFGTGFSG